MSRLNITFPWVFASLSGVQPASDLDDDFDAVPAGTITIGTRVLAASYVLTADDDYSYFLCVPTANMNLTLLGPVPPTDYSFFFSNQSTTKTVTLVGTVTIDGTPVLNPVFPGNFGSLNNVIGGLVVYDGSVWTLYPTPQQGVSVKSVSGRDSIALNDTSHVITHNLNDATAFLVGAYGDWNSGAPYISAQAANTITVQFPNQCTNNPGSLVWTVST